MKSKDISGFAALHFSAPPVNQPMSSSRCTRVLELIIMLDNLACRPCSLWPTLGYPGNSDELVACVAVPRCVVVLCSPCTAQPHCCLTATA
jgi:hypothetical protein